MCIGVYVCVCCCLSTAELSLCLHDNENATRSVKLEIGVRHATNVECHVRTSNVDEDEDDGGRRAGRGKRCDTRCPVGGVGSRRRRRRVGMGQRSFRLRHLPYLGLTHSPGAHPSNGLLRRFDMNLGRSERELEGKIELAIELFM